MDKTERATILGRRTREKIQKSKIKLTALRFQRGGKTSVSPASLRGFQKVDQTFDILFYQY